MSVQNSLAEISKNVVGGRVPVPPNQVPGGHLNTRQAHATTAHGLPKLIPSSECVLCPRAAEISHPPKHHQHEMR